jgi:hypothetical protein
VVDTDVQGIPGRAVQVADCRRLCRKTDMKCYRRDKDFLLYFLFYVR